MFANPAMLYRNFIAERGTARNRPILAFGQHSTAFKRTPKNAYLSSAKNCHPRYPCLVMTAYSPSHVTPTHTVFCDSSSSTPSASPTRSGRLSRAARQREWCKRSTPSSRRRSKTLALPLSRQGNAWDGDHRAFYWRSPSSIIDHHGDRASPWELVIV